MTIRTNENASDPRRWRRLFKRRLQAAIEAVWTTPHAAITAGVATKGLYRWLQETTKVTPTSEDLWRICRLGRISPEYLLFGRGEMIVQREMPFALAYGEGEWGWSRAKRDDLALALAGYLHAVAMDQADTHRSADLHRIEYAQDGDFPGAENDADFRRELSDIVLQESRKPLEDIERAVRAKVDELIDRRIIERWRAARA